MMVASGTRMAAQEQPAMTLSFSSLASTQAFSRAVRVLTPLCSISKRQITLMG